MLVVSHLCDKYLVVAGVGVIGDGFGVGCGIWSTGDRTGDILFRHELSACLKMRRCGELLAQLAG